MREAVRRKSMLIMLILSLIFIIGIGLIADYLLKQNRDASSFYNSSEIIGVMGTLSFFGALLTAFITMNAIPLELERRTIYTLLAKPLERYQFILGKFLGSLLLIACNLLIMAAIGFLFIVKHNPEVAGGLARSFVILFVSLTALCGLVILLTTVMPANGGALVALAIHYLGAKLGIFNVIAQNEDYYAGWRLLARGIYIVAKVLTPRVNKLNVFAPVGESPGQPQAILMVLGYTAVCLLLAMVLFGRKEL
jgi:ABC-type transport system involved in multi-copper enzyme maturation permease subunit